RVDVAQNLTQNSKRKRKRATVGVPKYDDGGKRTGVTKGRKRQRIREEQVCGWNRYYCVRGRTVLCFRV
ncbi:hypothetical protein ALC57_07731, partial [Trachymyrmex cornetzi]